MEEVRQQFMWYTESLPLTASEQRHIDRAFLMCVRYGALNQVKRQLTGKAQILALTEHGDNVMQVLCLGAKLPKDIWKTPDFKPEEHFQGERLEIYHMLQPRYKSALDVYQAESNRVFLENCVRINQALLKPAVTFRHLDWFSLNTWHFLLSDPVKDFVKPLRLPRQVVKARRLWRKVIRTDMQKKR